MTDFDFTVTYLDAEVLEIQGAVDRLVERGVAARSDREDSLLERFIRDNFTYIGRFIAAYGEDPDRFVLEDRTRFDGTLVFRDTHTGRYTVG